MLNGASLFPIVSSNGLIALYCSHVAFIIWRYCATLPLCARYSLFLSPSSLYLSVCLCLSHMLHPFISSTFSWPPSVCLAIATCTFFGLTGSHSRDSEAILSYIVTRQYCDGVPEGNLSDLTLLSFSSTEEAGVCLAEANKGVFHFQNGYQIQARRDFQSGMRKSELSHCTVAQEDVNFLAE